MGAGESNDARFVDGLRLSSLKNGRCHWMKVDTGLVTVADLYKKEGSRGLKEGLKKAKRA